MSFLLKKYITKVVLNGDYHSIYFFIVCLFKLFNLSNLSNVCLILFNLQGIEYTVAINYGKPLLTAKPDRPPATYS